MPIRRPDRWRRTAYGSLDRQRSSAELLDRLLNRNRRFQDREAARSTFAELANQLQNYKLSPAGSDAFRNRHGELQSMVERASMA